MRVSRYLLLVSVIACLGFSVMPSEAHKKPRPTPSRREKKGESDFFSVLRGFFNRVPPQNKRADELGIEQIHDAHELQHFIEEGILVPVPENGIGFRIDPVLQKSALVYANDPKLLSETRPWVLQFILDFSKLYHREIGERLKRELKITSLVRPVDYQQKIIIGKNGGHGAAFSSADCEKEDRCSLHARGIAVDISKLGMKKDEERWMRRVLSRFHRADIGVDVTEETRLNHFHVLVFPDYHGLLLSERKKPR